MTGPGPGAAGGVGPAEELRRVLEDARSAGFLGPGPVEPHLAHSEGFARAAETALGRPPASFADLGTGGGIPGLVLAVRWPQATATLVDSNQRRAAALRDALVRLDLEARVEVIEGRAEAVARSESHREQFELVTARSFGPPAVTAEIAAGLVAVGGAIVVSEPPDDTSGRWPADGLQALGLGQAERIGTVEAHFEVVRKLEPVPERFPRGVGRPAKRPLW